MRLFVCVILLVLLAVCSKVPAQIAISHSGDFPHPSAMLDIVSDSSGILVPRMTASQRDSISNPAVGLLVFVTDDQKFHFFNGSMWTPISGPMDDDWIVDADTLYSAADSTLTIKNGKIGIGTTNPYSTLTLGGWNPEISIGTSDGNDDSWLALSGGGFATPWRGAYMYLFGNEHENFAGSVAVHAGNEIDTTNGVYKGNIGFYTGPGASNTLRMKIERDGQVGIGTSTPTEKLEVAGTIFSSSGGFRFPDSTLQTTAATNGNFWSLGGNAGTDPDTNFIGTTDTTAFEIRINNRRVLRAEPTLYLGWIEECPNIILGDRINYIGSETHGATICGGGSQYLGWPNFIDSGSNFSSIGGGVGNAIGDSSSYVVEYGTIGGGSQNKVIGRSGTIGGGEENFADWECTVGGGFFNIADGLASTTGGGNSNRAQGDCCTVAGGFANSASGRYAAIGGGQWNKIGDTVGVYDSPIIAGGWGNAITASMAFIGGGFENAVTAAYGTIGGGLINRVEGLESTISGGYANHVDGQAGVVGGGFGNDIALSASYSVISGGSSNEVYSIGGSIGGGKRNKVYGQMGTIAGGGSPNIDTTMANRVYGDFGAIGGGIGNTAGGFGAVVGGGAYNQASAQFSTIGGGGPTDINNPTNTNNRVSGIWGTVSGGGGNVVDSTAGTISGGGNNHTTDQYGTIGGGYNNVAGYMGVISGGGYNTITDRYAAIGGGSSNSVGGQYATVPGGKSNSAIGRYSFAAGRRANANHPGSFVWADTTDADFTSTADHQFLIRASGGVGIGINNPSHRLTVYSETNSTMRLIGPDGFAGYGAKLNFGDLDLAYLEEDADDMLTIYADLRTAIMGGYVGIGTLNPLRELHVYSISNPRILVEAPAGQAPELNLQRGGTTHALYVNGGDDLVFYSLGDRVTFTNDGMVGIGTISPTAQIHATGTIRFSNFGAGTLQTDANGNVTVSSDERLKEIHRSFDRGLNALKQIQPVLYSWNIFSGMEKKGVYAGFSAQNIQAAIPEAIGTDINGFLTLSDRPIIASLVNAVKDLDTQNQELQSQLDDLSSEVAGLKALIQQFKASVNTQ